MAVLDWDQVQAIFGRGTKKLEWRLRWKQPYLSKGYLIAIIIAIFSFIVLPYGDEVIRCLRNEAKK